MNEFQKKWFFLLTCAEGMQHLFIFRFLKRHVSGENFLNVSSPLEV